MELEQLENLYLLYVLKAAQNYRCKKRSAQE